MEDFGRTSRRDFLKLGAGCLGATVISGAAPHAATRPATAGDIHVENVILIISDSLRRDALSCYGSRWVQTPHLGRFAQQAVVFDNAYHSSFPTVPLRNDVLTGRHTFTYKQWSPIDPDAVTLQETLGKEVILTSLVADTPHPFVPGYNYQRGFEAWQVVRGQESDPFRSAPREVKLPCAPGKLREPERTVVEEPVEALPLETEATPLEIEAAPPVVAFQAPAPLRMEVPVFAPPAGDARVRESRARVREALVSIREDIVAMLDERGGASDDAPPRRPKLPSLP